MIFSCGGETEAEEFTNAGIELQNQGRHEEAIAKYDEAIRLNPQDALAYYNRGNAYEDLGQTQRAIQDYDTGAPTTPTWVNTSEPSRTTMRVIEA